MQNEVERWGIFEIVQQGPRAGNPFTDIMLEADFSLQNRQVRVKGFYDGEGIFRIRFMPDAPGEWRYLTHSNVHSMDGLSGEFTCTPPSAGNHGPVVVRNTHHFAYADGTPYYPIGTTCYAWAHQGKSLEQQTLDTLRSAPFNKMRMCVFPKHYDFNHNEPELFAYERNADGSWDFTRFNPAFFRHFEQLVSSLCEMGIEADLILLHPYDRWGFASMGVENDENFLRYVVSRLSAYRNVWWSMANEYDLMKDRTLGDWDRYFQIVQEADPYQRLRSVHNCYTFYDHNKPWVTHASIQSGELTKMRQWCEMYQKPVIVDECGYEGNIWHNWGNLSARELIHLMWLGTLGGGYVGHGETYLHPEDQLWWSKGGVLRGESPARIAFMRHLLEELAPHGLKPFGSDYRLHQAADMENGVYLFYTGIHQPARVQLKLPAEEQYSVDIIDPWEMTITSLKEVYPGQSWISLPGKPYQVICARKAR